MSNPTGGSAETVPLRHENVTLLEADVLSVVHDDEHVYAACKDMKVRVWTKSNWHLVATLGETSSEPLGVHIDDEHIYATCEKRVYVWKKHTWGMIGWFELSYQAVSSIIYGDYLYVGAKDGRLVSIRKDTHETSSWQLHKSDISSLWANGDIICTCANKDRPRIWHYSADEPPSELAELEGKEKCAIISGSNEFVMVGFSTGEIKVWERVEFGFVKNLDLGIDEPVNSIWNNNQYLVASIGERAIAVWDLKSGAEVGSIELEDQDIRFVSADGENLYIATDVGLLVEHLTLGDVLLDLESEAGMEFGASLLRTSPYDVLEDVLSLKQDGESLLKAGEYHNAVTSFEKSLQLLIDNSHALLEVPEEQEKLTRELNTKLGRALLRSKIVELQDINERIEQISDEFEMRGRTDTEEKELEKLWREAASAVKESRVLAEAQAGDMLSYQLSYVADSLESDLQDAKEKVEQYRNKIKQVVALTQSIMSEWRWMERRRTTLAQRKAFLENARDRLEKRLEEVDEEDEEVREILEDAIEEHKRIQDQISRIIEASENGEEEEITDRDEALGAVDGLLKVMPKKRSELLSIKDTKERQQEKERLISALNQALETAEQHGFKEEMRNLENELHALEDVGESSEQIATEANVEAAEQD
ncbi:hypothetical protein EU538_02455 [Candidatus Thorarchaeota archaeon]|nr:MAG: hypothetical protein EU538_02455 [Candidatus Thorarchaeota archaeon]